MHPFVRLAASVALGATLLVPTSSVRAADNLIPGKITIIKEAKLTKMVAKPVSPSLFPLPTPGGPGDPTAASGNLSVTDVTDSQGLTTTLPSAGWKGLGNPPGSKGYKYKGAGSGMDPCKIVLVKEKVIKFVCKDDGNLDPPLGGAAAIELGLGTENYCAEFGGTEIKNVAGLTKRKDASAPSACGGGGGGTTTSSIATTTSSTTSSTFGPCCGGFTHGVFTSGVNGGTCGVVKNFDGSDYTSVLCGGLYTGGGENGYPLPEITPDLGQSVVALTSCVVQTATVGPTTSVETGSIRKCTSPGCLFGGPLPIINPATIPTSICVLNVVSQPATGTVECGLGEQDITLPVNSALYLTGDTATDPGDSIPGTQPCPLCSSGSCIGGPNNGMTCTPDDTDQGGTLAQYPTSHDCPPDPMLNVGTIPVNLRLGTGTVTWTGTIATNDTGNTISSQVRVFCGYCRDKNGTLAFEQPFHQCWENGMALNAACTEPFESCEQRDHGAFGPAGGAVKTITVIGTPAGNTFDGAPHAAKVVGNFCIPTFDPTVDASGNLPGPGATALNGVTELCSSANPCPGP